MNDSNLIAFLKESMLNAEWNYVYLNNLNTRFYISVRLLHFNIAYLTEIYKIFYNILFSI